MKWVISVLLVGACFSWQGMSFADGNADLIPELKDIEKIASEQEAAIRAQSDALLKAKKEKEAAEKAAVQAVEQQKALKAAEVATPATETPVAEKPVKKVNPRPVQKAPAKVDPWLAQERRYTFP
jgi:hypothetical protein